MANAWEVCLKLNQENGARVSTNRKDPFSGDFSFEIGEGLEDCEMNGVSSLLKMRRDLGEKDNGVPSKVEEKKEDLDVKLVNGLCEAMDEEEDESIDDGDHKFQVGDLVWGKIKSHPWWPGQIYDPRDASDVALKIKKKGRLLVAYFGDRTFAWCYPSQLKPFEENFKMFSKISSSRSFVYGVEDAVEEIGRQVELTMCNSFLAEEHLRGISTPFAENAGIKDGVLVPEIRRYAISSLKFEPHKVLDEIKISAKTLSLGDLLEREMLLRKLSAFYRAKGGYQLIEYHEPYPVPGLEDDSIERAVNSHKFRDLSEDDSVNSGKSDRRRLKKCSGFHEDRLYHRRKQKSIAEILEADTISQSKGEGRMAKLDVTSGRQKRKGSDEVKGDGGKTPTCSTPKRRKFNKISTIEDGGTKNIGESRKENSLSRKKRKQSSSVENDGEGQKTEKNIDSTEANDTSKASVLYDDMSPLSSLKKKIKIDVSNLEKSKNGDPQQQTPTDSLSRERKKSKYLSPPYTSDFSWKAKRNIIEADSLRGDGTGHLIETSQETSSKEYGDARRVVAGRPGEGQFSVCDSSRSNGMLALIREVAISPQFAKENRSHHLIGEFMSKFRNLTYHDGSGDKLEKEELKKHDDEYLEPNQEAGGSDAKIKLPETEKHGIHEVDYQESEAELFVMFSPGSSLPTKDDLIRIYSEFGPLNKERTDILYEDSCARVAFMRTSDAEKGFNSSQKTSPFVTSSSVSFRLQPLSASTTTHNEKGNGNKKNKKKREPKKVATSKPSVEAGSSFGINDIKEKLEEMRWVVEKSEGKMSGELKCRLEDEMKSLLEKLLRT